MLCLCSKLPGIMIITDEICYFQTKELVKVGMLKTTPKYRPNRSSRAGARSWTLVVSHTIVKQARAKHVWQSDLKERTVGGGTGVTVQCTTLTNN